MFTKRFCIYATSKLLTVEMKHEHFTLISHFVAAIFAKLSSAVNPIIYGLM